MMILTIKEKKEEAKLNLTIKKENKREKNKKITKREKSSHNKRKERRTKISHQKRKEIRREKNSHQLDWFLRISSRSASLTSITPNMSSEVQAQPYPPSFLS